ncbi:MAG TPA: T9SS type A sorting domain-containing protein, partial [Flavobacteriales bacterium]|nr:T9SS type A sorting domain-containing protein [Flavobacteriales bacterium]
ANCDCVGQPIGTLDCEGVLDGPALPGTACDDENASTTNDTWSANCTCLGTPVGPCSGDQVVVAINTDGNPDQLTWEITDESNVVIAAGGPAAVENNMLVSEVACLGAAPASACYGFRLYDSFGDGISGGNWQLRTMDDKVLLGDDFPNGGDSPSLTPAYAGYTEHSFCLPPGPAQIANKSCDIFNYTMNSYVYCRDVAGATSYQFEFSDPDAGFIRRIAVNTNKVRFNQMNTSPLTPGVKYFVRARTNDAGPMASAHFSTGCEVGMSVPFSVTCSELISAPTYGHSCNESRAFNTNNSFIYATPVVGATEYQFRISIPGEGYDETFIRSTYILQLKWNNHPPMVNGSTYNVQVNVKVGTLYSGFCGDVCTITIDNSGNRPEAGMAQTAGTATMWPNPVREGQVNLTIDGIRDAEQNITVDIQDIYGKQVFAKEFGNSGEHFTTILDLPGDIASGVYMVNIVVNGQHSVQRLSIIK